MLNQSEKDLLQKELETKGERQAREDYHMGQYSGLRKQYVELWLNGLERNADEKKHQDNLAINRSLKNSSWVAAIMAIISAIIAVASALITFYR